MIDYIKTHEIVCDRQNGLRELVRDVNTGKIDFILPTATLCRKSEEERSRFDSDMEPIVFALSPDAVYYAITDFMEYTSQYDGVTGERIVTLNFYGEELAFSDDSRYLITRSSTAVATWDIDELIANHAE